MGTTGFAIIAPVILSQVSSARISEVAFGLRIEEQAEFDDINWENIECFLTGPMISSLRVVVFYFTNLDLPVSSVFDHIRSQMPDLDKRGLLQLAEKPFW